ncbi:MAG: PAS domain S-box protein, partial [Chloroflexota bacterium]
QRRHKDGQIITVSVTVSPVKDATGRVVAVSIIGHDISLQVQREAELLVSQEGQRILARQAEENALRHAAEIQDLYEHAPTGYHSLDADGRVLLINQTELDWLGCPREEVIGRPFTDFLTPESQATLRTNFPKFKAQGYIHDLEFDLVRKDGSVLPILLSSTAIYDQAGQYVMSRSTLFDNSRRKQAEDALRYSEAKFEQAFYAAPVARTIRRMSDNRFIDANNQFLTIYHCTKEQVIGHTPAELGLRDYLAEDSELQRLLKQQGSFHNLEWEARTADGSPLYLLLSAAIIHAGGEEHLITTTVDITARKQAEKELRETQQWLRLALEAAEIGLWDWDLVTGQPSMSSEFKNQLGYQDDELENRTSAWEALVHPDDLGPAMEKVAECLQRGDSTYYNEYRMRHKDGRYLWVLAQAAVIKDEQGRPVRMMGSNIDITTIRQTHDRLEDRPASSARPTPLCCAPTRPKTSSWR